MSQNLQNVVKFQKFQLENLVDLEKCCKTDIFLQKSKPIQPKTSNILPNFAEKLEFADSLLGRRIQRDCPRRRRCRRRRGPCAAPGPPPHGFTFRNFAEFCKFLQIFGGLVLGCIDAEFAIQASFESSRRDLHHTHFSTDLRSQMFNQNLTVQHCNFYFVLVF